MMPQLNTIIISFVMLVNLLTFILFTIDKIKAKQGKYRIPEKVLLGFTLLGGSIGSIVAMIIWRHKIAKRSFVVKMILIIIIQISLLYWAYPHVWKIL